MKDRHYCILLIPVLVMVLLAVYRPVEASFRGFLQEDSGVTVLVGPFIQMASANTPYTVAFQTSGQSVFLSKNGAAPGAKSDPGALSPSGASGYFLTHLNATDTSTPGILVLYVHNSDCLIVDQSYQVVSKNPFGFFDSGASTYIEISNIKGVASTGVTLANNAIVPGGVTVTAGVTLVGGIVASGVTLSSPSQVWSEDITALYSGNDAGYKLAQIHSGVSFSSGAIIRGGVTLHTTAILPSGATLAADQDVRHVRGLVGSGVTLSSTAIVPSGVTVIGLTQAAVADFFDTDSGTNYGASVAGSVVKEIADNAGGSALTEAGIASAVTNALGDSGVTVHHNETVALAEFFSVDAGAYVAANVGSVVKEIADNAGGASLTEAGIASAVTTALGASGVSISASGTSRVITQFIDASAVSPIAYNVWGNSVRELTGLDEVRTTIDLNATTIGTVTSVTNGVNIAANQDIRNVTAIVGGGVTLSSTAILPSGATLAANQDVRNVTAIVGGGVTLSSTAILPSGATLAANQDVRNVTAIVGSGVTINVSGASRVGIDWGDITRQNSQVILSGTTISSGATVSQIWDGTVPEMSAGAPTATPMYRQILNYLYRGWRNKSLTTSSGVSSYADDGVTGLWEFEHGDDGTTYTKGEVKAYTP